MGTALFWAIKQRVAVIPYGRFGTTYRSHLHGSRIQESMLLGFWIRHSRPAVLNTTPFIEKLFSIESLA